MADDNEITQGMDKSGRSSSSSKSSLVDDKLVSKFIFLSLYYSTISAVMGLWNKFMVISEWINLNEIKFLKILTFWTLFF